MLTGGMWLESIPDAVRAYPGLVTANGLKSACRREVGGGAGTKGAGLIGYLITAAPFVQIRYQEPGRRQRPHRALALMDPAAARAWLEDRLGELKRFEVIEQGEKDEAM